MNGISLLQILREQFYTGKNVPPAIARQGVAWIQVTWLVCGLVLGVAYALVAPDVEAGSSVLAANAVFTALSVTMAMFFWPRAINLKNDPVFNVLPERWHVYRLTTQLFWTVLVGVFTTGLAVVALALPECPAFLQTFVNSVAVGLTVYQVLLLGQSVFRLYGATFWMPRA